MAEKWVGSGIFTQIMSSGPNLYTRRGKVLLGCDIRSRLLHISLEIFVTASFLKITKIGWDEMTSVCDTWYTVLLRLSVQSRITGYRESSI